MARPRRPSKSEMRETINSFLLSIDEPDRPLWANVLPIGGAVVPNLSHRRLNTAERLRNVTGATADDVRKLEEADKTKQAAKPDAGPTWLAPKHPPEPRK